MTETSTLDIDGVLGGLSIIDCDAHFTEPPDLWTSRASSSMVDRVPVMKTVDGTSSWFLDGGVLCSIGGNTLRRGDGKQLGTTCIYPNVRERLAQVMSGLDAHTRRRVLQDNAVELYGLPMSSAP